MLNLRALALAMILAVSSGCGPVTAVPVPPAGATRDAVPPALNLHDLVTDPALYDGQPVAVAGEVFGEVMARGSERRLLVQSGPDAVAVWAPMDLVSKIRHTGRKYIQGDTVWVSGTFHVRDAARGGEANILAAQIAVVALAGTLRPEYEGLRSGLMVIAWFASGILFGLWQWKKRR